VIRATIPIRLSTRIAYFRHAAGLTQFEVARRSGIGPKSIGSWETGHAEPRITQLLRILKACGVTPAEFFDCDLRLAESRIRVPGHREVIAHESVAN